MKPNCKNICLGCQANDLVGAMHASRPNKSNEASSCAARPRTEVALRPAQSSSRLSQLSCLLLSILFLLTAQLGVKHELYGQEHLLDANATQQKQAVNSEDHAQTALSSDQWKDLKEARKLAYDERKAKRQELAEQALNLSPFDEELLSEEEISLLQSMSETDIFPACVGQWLKADRWEAAAQAIALAKDPAFWARQYGSQCAHLKQHFFEEYLANYHPEIHYDFALAYEEVCHNERLIQNMKALSPTRSEDFNFLNACALDLEADLYVRRAAIERLVLGSNKDLKKSLCNKVLLSLAKQSLHLTEADECSSLFLHRWLCHAIAQIEEPWAQSLRAEYLQQAKPLAHNFINCIWNNPTMQCVKATHALAQDCPPEIAFQLESAAQRLEEYLQRAASNFPKSELSDGEVK